MKEIQICCISSADRVVLGVAWEENESDSPKLCSDKNLGVRSPPLLTRDLSIQTLVLNMKM